MKDSFFFFGCGVIAFGLWEIHPAACFIFVGIVICLIAITLKGKRERKI